MGDAESAGRTSQSAGEIRRTSVGKADKPRKHVARWRQDWHGASGGRDYGQGTVPGLSPGARHPHLTRPRLDPDGTTAIFCVIFEPARF